YLSLLFIQWVVVRCRLHSFPTRRSSDLSPGRRWCVFHRIRWPPSSTACAPWNRVRHCGTCGSSRMSPLPCSPGSPPMRPAVSPRSEEHTSELQSRENLVCRLLLEKKITY